MANTLNLSLFMMAHRVVYVTKLLRNDEMCQGVNEVCDNTYSNCQWCNSTTGSDDGIGFCDLGKLLNLL